MIGFVLVGTNDLDRAALFYDEICSALGAKRLYSMTNGCTGVMYGTGDGPMLGVVLPFNGEPARPGNGVMVALPTASIEEVERVHALAISLGGLDEGAPGPRGDGTAYCAYFRDPDGNKICVFCSLT
ncbi:VOC family protein (plasmid) [Methylocystis rosea]|uniref:VOC family protein n=1 Tax=Methylocystis rosea TaxID=173366 RepID=A0A3G8MA65_9HYPH|nr:VOC family protein [Methylocystis rosea]AZG78781.1 VOC family protein [Methylocystis rosea]